MTYELPKDGAPDKLRIVDMIINLLQSLDGRDNRYEYLWCWCAAYLLLQYFANWSFFVIGPMMIKEDIVRWRRARLEAAIGNHCHLLS